MLKNAYLLAKIGVDTAENERFFIFARIGRTIFTGGARRGGRGPRGGGGRGPRRRTLGAAWALRTAVRRKQWRNHGQISFVFGRIGDVLIFVRRKPAGIDGAIPVRSSPPVRPKLLPKLHYQTRSATRRRRSSVWEKRSRRCPSLSFICVVVLSGMVLVAKE